VLCFGGRTTGTEIAYEMVEKYLTTEFLGDRHQKRIDKIAKIEESKN
jgi:ribose 5-phosphate isomerase B